MVVDSLSNLELAGSAAVAAVYADSALQMAAKGYIDEAQATALISDGANKFLAGAQPKLDPNNLTAADIDVSEFSDSVSDEVAAVNAMTKNPQYVSADVLQNVAGDGGYLDGVFDNVDVLATIAFSSEDDMNGTTQGSAEFATQTQKMMKNVNDVLGNMNGAATNQKAKLLARGGGQKGDNATAQLNDLANSVATKSAQTATVALTSAAEGETVIFTSATQVVSGTKIVANPNDTATPPRCGVGDEGMTLPRGLIEQEAGRAVSCAFVKSLDNPFLSTKTKEKVRQSPTITTTASGTSRRRRRRRLAEDMAFESNECFPYLISMQLSNTSLEFDLDFKFGVGNFSWPSCEFWSTGETQWDTSGCFVYNISNSTITCGCTHLTTFSISKDEILPEANLLTSLDFRDLSGDNLVKYPIVWVTCLTFFLVAMTICIAVPYCKDVEERSVLAFEDVIYKSFQEQQLYQDIAGMEIKYMTEKMPNPHLLGRGLSKLGKNRESKKGLFGLQFNLWKSYLRNEHTLLALFQRTAGTNYSTQQRLGHFFMYVTGIMMVTGSFYGTTAINIVQSILISFFSSLFGTLPPVITKLLFVKSKPTVQKSKKHDIDEIEKRLGIDHKKGVGQDDAKHEDSDQEDGNKLEAVTSVTVTDQKEEEDDDQEGEGEGPVSTKAGDTLTTPDVNWADGGYASIRGFISEQGNFTLKAFTAHLSSVYADDDYDKKILAINEVRKALYDQLYPLPHFTRYIAWVLVILWSATCVVVSIVYGIQFDQAALAVANEDNPNAELYASSSCWNTTLSLQLEADASKAQFESDALDQKLAESGSYGGGDSASWLLSIAQSLLMSIILWQPMTLYIVTWIKLWAFTWHLKMATGPGVMIALVKNVCCAKNDDDENNDDDDNGPADQVRLRRDKSSIVANENRPFDVISFLGNDQWIIDDTDIADEVAATEWAEAQSGGLVELETIRQDEIVDAIAAIDVEDAAAHARTASAAANHVIGGTMTISDDALNLVTAAIDQAEIEDEIDEADANAATEDENDDILLFDTALGIMHSETLRSSDNNALAAPGTKDKPTHHTQVTSQSGIKLEDVAEYIEDIMIDVDDEDADDDNDDGLMDVVIDQVKAENENEKETAQKQQKDKKDQTQKKNDSNNDNVGDGNDDDDESEEMVDFINDIVSDHDGADGANNDVDEDEDEDDLMADVIDLVVSQKTERR